jgi:hypothetical protein
MSKQEQLAAFLNQHVTLPRPPSVFAAGLYPTPWRSPQPSRPSADELAQ